jgi:TonB-dependent starch-binding outer membrane protein SusC
MSMHFKRLTFLLVILSYSAQLIAQTHNVSGNVKDLMADSPLPGVTILVKGTTTGTTTDFDGNYSINVDPNATLVFSFVGYESAEEEVNGRTEINVLLSPAIEVLSELVVIGYGTQKKKVVTGAIASVGADEIVSTPVLRIDQAMQGRTAGVQVTNLSGQPGEPPTIRVRGAGTTGNADPLFIVDGLAVRNIDYLNPGDIESIDVLKDGASAAIYGARAANGVILITTKSGKKGEMNVTLSSYQGIQNVARTIDMLDADQYRMIWNESRVNSGLSPRFDLGEIPKYNTNWQDHLFQKNAPIANHELSVSGGTEKSTYSSSLSFFSQQGIIGGDKSQFDRFTARINSRHQVTNWFEFGNNLAYSQINRRGIASNQSFNGAYSSALNLDPLTPLYEQDEAVLNDPLRPYSSFPVVKSSDGLVYGISEMVEAEIVNPLALLEIQNARNRSDRFVGNVFGDFKIIEGLTFNTSFGLDLAYFLGDSYRPFFYLNGAQLETEQTSVNKYMGRTFNWQIENTLRYARTIGDHNFSALVGTTASKSFYEDLTGFNTNVPINDPVHVYLNLATGDDWEAYGGANHSSLLAVFGRITYDFKSRYSFTGIIRRDGSSKFGSNRRFGTFPSVGFSWVLSDEEFMPDLGPVDVLKLRASYGLNGNQEIGDYQFISVMDNSRSYIFGGGRLIGASPQYIENADIAWEESEQINFASDLGAFNNRLTATFDYYIKTTRGLLERIPIPAHVGNDPPFANVGSVQNRGVEMSVNWRNVAGNFRYSVGVNASYNKNKMTKIGNEEGVLGGASWAVAGMVTRTEIGLPIAYFYGFKTDGIFQSQAEVFQHIGPNGQVLQPFAKPGDVRFVDVNEDGTISPLDRTIIGNPTPDWTFGMNGSLEYKQFDFSFLLVGTYGNDVFNGSQRQDLFYTNRTTAILDRWTPDKPSSTTPRVAWTDVNGNYRVSDLYIEDGSFLRVKNIQFGYTLPESIQNRIRAKNLRFYVSAENLLTLTSYTGADPEIGAMSSFDIGIDRGIYPQARTFRLGTTITF